MDAISKIKYSRVRKLSRVSSFPRTFDERLNAFPHPLLESLTAKQIAAIIDGPMDSSYKAGYETGFEDGRS